MRLRLLVASLAIAVSCGQDAPLPERPELVPLILPSRDAVAAQLADLDFDAFVERSFIEILRRSPMTLSDLGLSEQLGLDNQHIDDVSLAFAAETAAIEGDIVDKLDAFLTSTLTAEQRLVADTYRWWLEDQRALAEFERHRYLLQPSFRGVHTQLELLMTEIHGIEDRSDADDYVLRLWRIADVIDQAIARTEASADAGIIPPRIVLDLTREQLDAFTSRAPADTPYYQSLVRKAGAAGVGDGEMLAAARFAIAEAVLPAYRRLADLAGRLAPRAPSAVGVAEHPGGAAYYAAALRHHTTTDLDAAAVGQLGRDQLVEINARVRALFDRLGYPEDASVATNYRRAATDGGIVAAADVERTYEDLIADASERAADLFTRLPKAPVDVVLVDGGGGYYIGPSLDGERPGAFYAGRGAQPYLTMPTLAYHEAIPGHHLQIATAAELTDVPLFQRVAGFTGYVEGWGLYAETLAAEQGWFDSPYAELGYLQFQAYRAARLVVDTGIHTGGMTFQDAVQYMVDNVGFGRAAAEGQIFRYVTWPGQATAYMVGQLELLDLRQERRTRLGADFDLKAFHDVVLERGALPLSVLRARFAE